VQRIGTHDMINSWIKIRQDSKMIDMYRVMCLVQHDKKQDYIHIYL